jgi:putative membrane protein
MLTPTLKKNDKLANLVVGSVSMIVFVTVVALKNIELGAQPGFDIHIFARINAVINTIVSLLLIGGLMAVKARRFALHKRIMIAAIICSVLFLLSYICHHLLAGDTKFGGVGLIRPVYFFILITHIILAAIILPFILFTSYRALIGEWHAHRKLAKLTWPIWFYVSVTGVIVYIMISPYYS